MDLLRAPFSIRSTLLSSDSAAAARGPQTFPFTSLDVTLGADHEDWTAFTPRRAFRWLPTSHTSRTPMRKALHDLAWIVWSFGFPIPSEATAQSRESVFSIKTAHVLQGPRVSGTQNLEPDCLSSNPSYATHYLHDFGQTTHALCVSGSSSVWCRW